MQTTKSNIQHVWTVIFILLPAFLWMLSSGDLATAGYADSAHGDSTNGVNRSTAACENWPGGLCTTGSCAHCHDTFDPTICGVNDHMLFFFPLDGAGGNDDLCMQCHRPSGSLQVQPPNMPDASKDIYTIFKGTPPFYYDAKDFQHKVLDYSGIHKFWPISPPADSGDVEDRTYLSDNKHVECNDCHNPHLAEYGLHTSNEVHVAAGPNEIADSGPLTGAFGVEPDAWNANWGGADWTGVTTSSTATKEYQICFKCHSDFNTNPSGWNSANIDWTDTTGPSAWTDVALEFNPSNQSYHPVVQALPATDPGVNGSSRIPPAFTSLVIGDSGKATGMTTSTITDSTKSTVWTANKWQNWGVRIGNFNLTSNVVYNNIRRISSNTTTQLTVTPNFSGTVSYTWATYSIEYYAGQGTKSGNTITDTNKDFTQYVSSLEGYTVVISNDTGSQLGRGTVVSNNATSFTVSGWSDGNPYGGLWTPGDGTVGYYFSGTGKTMMCSDCHSNDTISTAAAQGPHGSNVKWMLKGRNRAWPKNSAADNGQGSAGFGTLYVLGSYTTSNSIYKNDGSANGNGLFCLNCHSTVSFCKDDLGLASSSAEFNIHTHRHGGKACVRCHIMVPHGGKMSRLIGDSDGTMPERYAYNNVLGQMDTQSFRKAAGGLYGDGPTRYYQEGIKCGADCHLPAGSPDENW
jgi:hypothetical protein